jgi:ABC-type polysaccharide/polyol phosphate export permease
MAVSEASAVRASRTGQRRQTARLPLQLVLFEIRVRAAGSVLGVGWAILQPLLFLATYWYLLTVLRAKHLGPGGNDAQLSVLLSGLVAWLFIARSMGSSLGMLTSHAGLIRNINFPLAVLPFVTVGSKAVDFLVGIIVVLASVILAGLLSWTALLLIPVSLLLGAFLVALAALLGPLAVMLRDLTRLTQVVLRIGLFVTPVLYLPSALPHQVEGFAYFNPAAYFVSLIRYAATGLPQALMFDLPTDLAIATAITAAMGLAAYLSRDFTRNRVVDHL